MDDMREKLVDLVHDGESQCSKHLCIKCQHFSKLSKCKANMISDYLIANGVCLEEKQATSDKTSKWISVTERLPEPETEVLILAEGKRYSFKGTVTTYHIVTTGMYEDGSKNTEDSEWCWYDHDFKYDEELDVYIIPEGWWEYKHYNGDDEHNHSIDNTVTHWMPLPEPPKGE